MKKKTKMILGMISYCLGFVFALYVGGWILFIQPIIELFEAYQKGTIGVLLVAVCIIKIVLSTTIAGFVWCIGYIGYNYCKGTEDPDWRALKEKFKVKKNKEIQ